MCVGAYQSSGSVDAKRPRVGAVEPRGLGEAEGMVRFHGVLKRSGRVASDACKVS